MGGLVARQAEEVRVVRESQRRAKERTVALERHLKEQNDDIHNKNKLLTKLKSLVIDKELPERDDLNRQLTKVKGDLEAINEKTKVCVCVCVFVIYSIFHVCDMQYVQ
jgi:uncharacterized protein YpuA (DUF1002 family)